MDYVYVCRSGPNEELRYSIRSVIKNMPEGNIWLIGGKPDWYNGNFIPMKNVGDKFDTINNCLFNVSKISEISDDFVFMNDDFFVMHPVDFMINFHGGALENRIDIHRQASPVARYTRMLQKTQEILKLAGIRIPLDFDLHMPMIFNKQKLSQLKLGPVLLRSMYGNLFNTPAFEIKDVKVYSKDERLSQFKQHDPKENNFRYFSTEDDSFDQYKDWLQSKFPNPSKYEIDKR